MGAKYRNVIREQRKCKCGKGHVFYYDREWESDYPPFDKVEDGGSKTDCPDNCENLPKK